MVQNERLRILFLGQLPENISPSQRFRIEQYYPYLPADRFQFFFQPFITSRYLPYIYKRGYFLKKAIGVVNGFLNRCKGLYVYRRVDFVFIQREASIIGPPVFEWIYSKILRKKIIYDFDDAIWIPNSTDGFTIVEHLKCFWKVKRICSWSYKVSVGNSFLKAWARQYNSNVIYNPTCVDLRRRYTISVDQTHASRLAIGWTGSHSTLKYLKPLIPILKKLEDEFSFTFLVICNERPSFDLRSLVFKEWNAATEVEDLSAIHIGVMPLSTDEWSEGKCGFKLLQYMALGIATVASPVGVNSSIVNHGSNGFLASTEQEWYQYMKELLGDGHLREQLAKNGKRTVHDRYSVENNLKTFISIFT